MSLCDLFWYLKPGTTLSFFESLKSCEPYLSTLLSLVVYGYFILPQVNPWIIGNGSRAWRIRPFRLKMEMALKSSHGQTGRMANRLTSWAKMDSLRFGLQKKLLAFNPFRRPPSFGMPPPSGDYFSLLSDICHGLTFTRLIHPLPFSGNLDDGWEHVLSVIVSKCQAKHTTHNHIPTQYHNFLFVPTTARKSASQPTKKLSNGAQLGKKWLKRGASISPSK